MSLGDRLPPAATFTVSGDDIRMEILRRLGAVGEPIVALTAATEWAP